MLGVAVLLIMSFASMRCPYPFLFAGGYSLLVFTWSLSFDDWEGAGLRAMMSFAFAIMFFFTLDRTRHLPWAWFSTLALGLLVWWLWPYLIM